MKKSYFLLAAFALSMSLAAQDGIGSDYTEPDDGSTADATQWSAISDGLQASWASRDARYALREVPSVKMRTDTTVYAWRGERVNMQAVLFSKAQTGTVSLALTGDNAALAEGSEARFVNYVITNDFRGCTKNYNQANYTTYLTPDVIDIETQKALPAMTTRPVWVNVEVPRDLDAGTYHLTLTVTETGAESHTLGLDVVVSERQLPEPHDYAFQLNFWMQPYAASRYYQVDNWSQAHFDALRPYMQMLARAGQKAAFAVLFYEPWGEQSNDKFLPMVETTKETDGSWSFDYTVFDEWIEFQMSCGIDQQINCFSMLPWDMSFRYTDASTGSYAYVNAGTTDDAYKELWTALLTDFAAHLTEKGWLDKTVLAMDERGESDMLNAYEIAQAAVPGIKMALAGNYHSSLVDKLYEYCVAYGQTFSETELANREAKGWVSTTYTACPDGEPNVCSNNNPADGAFLPVYCTANGFNGFLRWAWMNWTDDPLRDTRFKFFTPGDTYIVYPGGRSSIRWERFTEGVQQAEKIRLLREEYAAAGDETSLATLNTAVENFKSGTVSATSTSAYLVNYLESVLNGSPTPGLEPAESYCEVGPTNNNNRATALAQRWLAAASTSGALQDLDYASTVPTATGYIVCNDTIKATRGTTFTLTVKPATYDDGLQWCRDALFADWNADSIFDTTTETIARAGNAKADNSTTLLEQTFSLTVPTTAALGTTRLRLTYADAWSDLPYACGDLQKGFAMDFPLAIVEDEPTAIKQTLTQPKTRWENGTLQLPRPARLYVYSFAGALLDSTPAVSQYSTSDFTPGNYIILVKYTDGGQASFKFHK